MTTLRAVPFALILSLAAVGAAHAEVAAWVDNRNVAEGVPFFLWVEASGTSVEEPILPSVPGLTIDERPRTVSDSFSFAGTKASKKIKRGYIAQAEREGSITIPRITVRIDGKEEFSQEIVLNVGAGQSNTGRGPASNPSTADDPTDRRPGEPTPSGAGDNQTRRDPTWEDLVFVTSDVDKETYYLGERVELTIRLWTIDHYGVDVFAYRGQNIRFPTSEGFYATDIKELRQDREERRGLTYKVMGYRQYLYPTRTGTLTIGSYHWEGRARARTVQGIRPKEYVLDTPAIEIEVLPLPPRPENFSGAVGTFRIDAAIEAEELLQGVQTELVVKLSGDGNPDAMGEPVMEKIEGAYIGEPEIALRSADAEGEIVEKLFTYTVVPLNEGELTIPPLEYVYFDPEAGEYRTERAGPFRWNVLPSPEQEQRMVVSDGLNLQEQRVHVLGRDINPIVRGPIRLSRAGGTSPVFVTVAVLPAALYVMFALYTVRRNRFEQDVAYARSYHARSKGQKLLREVRNEPEPTDALYRAVSGVVADAFNVPAAGLTSSDARRLLEDGGVSAECRENILKVMKSCERARYGTTELSQGELKALVDAASQEIDRLDAEMKRTRKR